ncbi:MAG TPA: type II toxin-antitoxin system Phd/YefM family antitoxin [Candidatus Binataceae bacterium]|jgi:prevent-host-death family protein
MRTVQASDAKARLLKILDEVEGGETVVITRHGRAIARLVPEVGRRQEEIDKAIETLKSLGRRTGRIKTSELLSARHQGHRY